MSSKPAVIWNRYSRCTPALLALAVSLSACKKDDAEKPADEVAAAADSAGDAAASVVEKAAGAVATGAPLSSDARIGNHGEVLGHVLLPNASQMLKEVKNQLAVAQAEAFVDEGFLRGLLASQLGKRSGISQNVLLDQSIGCAILDPKAFEMPAACQLSYKGGLDQLLTDLGDEGKQTDAAGHAAHYKMGGESLFVDKLGDTLVVSGHTDVFGRAKGYIEDNFMGRAGKVASDVEFVAYLAPIMQKYEKDLKPLLDLMNAGQATPTKTGDPKLDRVIETWTKYNAKSTQDSIKRFAEMEQLTIGIGLEDLGFVARFAVFPQPGSRLQKEAMANAAGPVDREFVQSLPSSSWFVVGAAYDHDKAWKTETAQEARDLFATSYAELAGRDADKIKEQLNEFMEESRKLYGSNMAFAMAYEPGTVGGLITVQDLKEGAVARESWREWSKRFTAKNVIPKDYQAYVTWSFEQDASTVDGVPVDRWTIEPTGKVIEELDREAARDSDVAKAKDMLGGWKFVIDRAESNGKVTYIIAPGAEDKYLASALAAQKGQGSIADDAGLARVAQRHPEVSGMFGLHVGKTMEWVRALLPADKTSQLPSDLGNDLGDVFMVSSSGEAGLSTGEFVISQGFINQLRALAQKQG